jgi:formylmethanofuran dehydrogenase subunit E
MLESSATSGSDAMKTLQERIRFMAHWPLGRCSETEIQNKNAQQMRAYREMPDEELFAASWVRVTLGPEEFPGYKGERAVCVECGEGINFKREVIRDGRVLCKACAGERYYEPL